MVLSPASLSPPRLSHRLFGEVMARRSARIDELARVLGVSSGEALAATTPLVKEDLVQVRPGILPEFHTVLLTARGVGELEKSLGTKTSFLLALAGGVAVTGLFFIHLL